MAVKKKLDEHEYKRLARKSCFVCDIIKGNKEDQTHEIIYQDADRVAFLNNFPLQRGHALVSPKKHAKHIFTDLTSAEYGQLLGLARRVGQAIQEATGAVRMYLVSYGSNEQNDHIHLHLFPLPLGVPLDQQQGSALSYKRNKYIEYTRAEKKELANKIRNCLNRK